MSNLNIVNTLLYGNSRGSFTGECQRFTNSTYVSFKSSYVNTCNDAYIQRMAGQLDILYNKIKNGYIKINDWFSDYNNTLGQLEKSLCLGTSNLITESSLRAYVNSHLTKLPDVKHKIPKLITPNSLKKINKKNFINNTTVSVVSDNFSNLYTDYNKVNSNASIFSLNDGFYDSQYSTVLCDVSTSICGIISTFSTQIGKISYDITKTITEDEFFQSAVDEFNYYKEHPEEYQKLVVEEEQQSNPGILDSIGSWVGDIYDGLFNAGKNIYNKVEDVKSSVCSFVSSCWDSLCNQINSLITWWNDEALPWLSDVATNALDFLENCGATVCSFVTSVIGGVVGFIENIFDAIVSFSGWLLYDTFISYIFDFFGGEGYSEKAKSDLQSFVSEKHVESAVNFVYENTDFGNWMNENAYFNDIVKSVGIGVGNVVAIVAASILTCGAAGIAGGTAAATGVTTGFGAAAGFGRGTEAAWANGANFEQGILTGTFNAAWEGLQWYVGGQIGGADGFASKITGKILGEGSAVATKALTIGLTVGLDAIDGAAEGFAQPLIQTIYTDGYYDKNGNYIEFTNSDDIFKRYSEVFDDSGGFTNVLINGAIGGGLSFIGEAFDLGSRLFRNNSTKAEVETVDLNNIEFNLEHGYQMDVSDFGPMYTAFADNGFFSKEQVKNIIDEVNNKGFLDLETGNHLKGLFNDDYDVYLKTVHSKDLNSIYENGVYCNGNLTSGFVETSNYLKDINLENTITKADGLFDLVRKMKEATGYSQGGNPINGTLVLHIPKGISIDDLILESNGKFSIDPKYIDGFAGVDESGIIGNYSYNLNEWYYSAKLNELAIKYEPAITNQLKLFEDNSSKLIGLKNKFKHKDSLARKIKSDALDSNITYDESASQIKDALRYTLQIDESKYTEKVSNVLDNLKENGYKINKFKNFWGDGLYQGINTQIESPEGYIFELQFHTEQSFYTKENLNHKYYEIARNVNSTEEEINEAREMMRKNQSLVKIPEGAIGLEMR